MDNISQYILSHLAKPIPHMELLAMERLLTLMNDEERRKLYDVFYKMLYDNGCKPLELFDIELLDRDLFDWDCIAELYQKLRNYCKDDDKRDKSISELLRLTKAGGDDGYACVMELCDRFSYQSFDDRKRIIKGLLRDAPDCICNNMMSDMWGEILIDDIVRMWRREKNIRYNRYIIQFANEDFVWEHIDKLSEYCDDYYLLCRRLGNHPDFEIERRKFGSTWSYYSTLKHLGHEIDGEQMLEELFSVIRHYILNPQGSFWLIERELRPHNIPNYISAKLIPDVKTAILEFNDMRLRDEILFFYEWDDAIRQLVNEKLTEQNTATDQRLGTYDVWILYCHFARHNFPDKFAFMVAIDPRRVECRNEMLGKLKPYIEQLGLEIEGDIDDLNLYNDKPSYDHRIGTPTIDDAPF